MRMTVGPFKQYSIIQPRTDQLITEHEIWEVTPEELGIAIRKVSKSAIQLMFKFYIMDNKKKNLLGICKPTYTLLKIRATFPEAYDRI